tara:strand:+ start:31396 stop:32997 length:1602 start_codon:yes stop_codon:yes gene_type:complete
MSPTSPLCSEKGYLFKDGWVDTNEVGLPFFPHCDIHAKSKVLHIIHNLYMKLHADESKSHKIKMEIDRYWLVLFLESVKSPLLLKMPWDFFVIRPENVFQLRHLPDIGPFIRQLSMHRNISDNITCRIIQYSLPYVKHNRLNFPRYSDVPQSTLIDLIRIMLAMLLSIYPHSNKQALWQLRFKIYVYIYTLISHGNQHDQYTFCLNNINLIRIAMIEYFVYFVNAYLPCELEVLTTLFGSNGNVQQLFRQFIVNIEHFRAQNLQNTDLSWERIHQKSHYIIERCNRLCKGKPKLSVSTKRCRSYDVKVLNNYKMLDIPRCTHPITSKLFMPNIDFEEMSNIHFVHSNVYAFTLPKSLWTIQANALKEKLQMDTLLYQNCIYLYICFRCFCCNPHVMQQMRLDMNGNKYCQYCHQHDAVHAINVLGRILCLFSKKYYFCHECLLLHEWNSSGEEFFSCKKNHDKLQVCKNECILCKRIVNLSKIEVLDTSLGIKHSMYLCARHTPREYQLPYIHDVPALVQCLKKRQEMRFGIR